MGINDRPTTPKPNYNPPPQKRNIVDWLFGTQAHSASPDDRAAFDEAIAGLRRTPQALPPSHFYFYTSLPKASERDRPTESYVVGTCPHCGESAIEVINQNSNARVCLCPSCMLEPKRHATTGATQRLVRACTVCGDELPPDAAHCIGCGMAVERMVFE